MAARLISTLAFLSLLGLNQAADPHCEDLLKPLMLEDDYSSLMGRWICHEGMMNHVFYRHHFKRINSSWVEFSHTSLADTVTYSYMNKIHEMCETETINITFKHGTMSGVGKYGTFSGDFLASSPDCFTFLFTNVIHDMTMKSLCLFSRSPKVSESERDLFRKQSECLGLKKEIHFIYDGVAEFCKDEKNSTSTDETKPDEKKVD